MSVQQIKRGDGSLPVYRQISESLRLEIQNFYKVGDVLPSELDLAVRYSVNRHTLRRAVDELVQDGLVVRQHGKGVFVLSPSIEYPIETQTRFTETLETLGVTTQSRVVRKQILRAQGGVAKRLKLMEGEDVIFLETLREVQGKPFCICSHFIPMYGYESLFESYSFGSLHQFLAERCATHVRRTESLISAVMPELDDCALLKMPRNFPVMRVKSVNVNVTGGRPVEYVITRFRGDAAQIAVLPR